jgi:hypothetical protein
MAYVYTAWPDASAVIEMLAAANITLPGTVTGDVIQLHIDSAAASMQQETHRQFVPGTAGETRYFDGSGNAMMEIDEFITITAVEFLWFPLVAGVNLANFSVISKKTFPNTKIYIYQGAANATYAYIHTFPKGRNNIKITGTWGYAATIPQDVWKAVAAKAAGELATLNAMTAQGRLVSWTDLDVSENYGTEHCEEAAGWTKQYNKAVKIHKKTLRSLLSSHQVELM